jgi:pimeloyl-ACP methyl ester carboxylesterase
VPTIVAVPCFSGAPWDLKRLKPLSDLPLVTMRLPERYDDLDRLSKIEVPTLIITPSYDTLIGEKAASEMLKGVQNVKEIVLARTGHMFRYSHPVLYAKTIRTFLEEQFGDHMSEACM